MTETQKRVNSTRCCYGSGNDGNLLLSLYDTGPAYVGCSCFEHSFLRRDTGSLFARLLSDCCESCK